jgi:hypothetical protein
VAAPECDKFGEDLSAYLDGELPRQRAAELEQHLLGCESCRGTFEQLRDVAGRLAELPHVRAPGQLSVAMRRATERQVLLEARAPRRKIRVWTLFARVSASAALIAACMFAGWHVYERVQRSATPSVEERLAMSREGEKASEKALRRETRSLDVLQVEPAERFADAAIPAEPVLALADKAKGVEAEAPIEAYAGVLARERVAIGGGELQADSFGVPVAAITTPTIDVFVVAQDVQQATAVRNTLAAWQKPVGAELGGGERGGAEWRAGGTVDAGAPVVRAGGAGAAETAGRSEFAFELTPVQANELIDQLEQQAPRQVLLRYADMQHVQQAAERDELDHLVERRLVDELGRPVAAPPADTEEECQALARARLSGEVEARRAVTSKRFMPRSSAGKQEEADERHGRGRGAEPLAPAKAAKKDEKAATAERGASAAHQLRQPVLRGGGMGGGAGIGAGKRAPDRAAEPMAPPASQPPPAAEQPATQPAQPEQLRARVARVREQLGELLFGPFTRAVAQPAAASQPLPPQPITVRVMLLPAPQAPATQPAAQPVPQP